ncbi:MAG TPA: hypothetical protein VF121_12030 [Thermoanaerobaculia bacterium]|nr:hypothetical protein [Thermoanaerobaculia bacterium]
MQHARSAWLLLGSLLWLVAGSACSRVEPRAAAATSIPGPETLVAVEPHRLPEVVRDRYRLRPDRRFRLAIAEVHRVLSGRDAEAVRVELQGGLWRVWVGDQEIGTLPEVPGFADADALLTAWARRLPPTRVSAADGAKDGEILERAVNDADPEALLAALAALYGPLDRQLVRRATAGFVWLATLTVDTLEQADPLHGRAWALLALAKALGATDLAAEEALLANALGYEAAAVRAAQTLPERDPVRLFVERDVARLAALCSQRPADRQCHCLHLALLAERGEDERFPRALASSPFGDAASFPALGLTLRLGDFGEGAAAGRSLAELAFRNVEAPPGLLGQLRSALGEASGEVEARTRAFEANVRAAARQRQGGLLDAGSVEAFFRAAFYSGLHAQAVFFLDQLASGAAARELATRMSDPAPGTAAELKRWIELSAAVRDGSREMAPLVEAIPALGSIGSAPLLELSGTVRRHVTTTDPLRRKAIPALFAALDSRPAHLAGAATVAAQSLTSPLLYETYAGAAAAAAPHASGSLAVTVALLDEDAKRLRAIADDPAMSSHTRAAALAGLQEVGGAEGTFVKAHYAALAAAPDGDLNPLLWLLEKDGDLAAASAVVEDALRRHTAGPDLLWAHLLTHQARLLRLQGRLDQAFAVLEPALPTWKEEVLLEAADLQLRRGRLAEGLRLARAALERYPQSAEASALIARAQWQAGDFAGAARELAASRSGVVREWSTLLPDAFAEVFAGTPDEGARRAFAELERAGIAPHILADLALALARKGDHEVAVRLVEALRDPLPEWHTKVQIDTYDLLRAKVGPEAALAWVRKRVPASSSQLALTLFQMRKYDLLLDLLPPGAESEKPGVVRLLKAASLLHLQEGASSRRAALVAALEAEPAQDDFFVRAALFLLGRQGEAAVLRPLPDVTYAASVGWAMGLEAASEGRFQDAEPWFQVALESGQQQQPPHAWSFLVLSDWLANRRSLRLQEKTRRF